MENQNTSKRQLESSFSFMSGDLMRQRRADMNLARSSPSLCTIMGALIFAVGGRFQEDNDQFLNKYSNQTEKYYMIDDEWEIQTPVLNSPKLGVALCKFKNRFLYAFGGDNGLVKNNIVDEIERLDLAELEDSSDSDSNSRNQRFGGEVQKWELLYIKKKQWTPLCFCLATLIDDESILLIGGRKNLTESSGAYIFNAEEEILKPFPQQMMMKDHFHRNGSQVAKLYNQIFFLGTNYIHCWSFELSKWILASEAYIDLVPKIKNQQQNDDEKQQVQEQIDQEEEEKSYKNEDQNNQHNFQTKQDQDIEYQESYQDINYESSDHESDKEQQLK
eukprot:403366814